MIGIDTNVLVRLFQQDDPEQTAKASALFASFRGERRGFVAGTVLAELEWVLSSRYKVSRSEVAEVLQRLLLSQEVVIEQAPIAWEALRVYRSSRADFADCLIERIGASVGCEYTVTYDKAAAKTAGMRLLE